MSRRIGWPLVVSLLWGCAGESTPEPTQQAPRDPAPAEPYEPGALGPYGVGVETIQFTDSRGIDLTVEVWYPAKVADTDGPDPYELPLVFEGRRGVPVDTRGAPYPLIGFSHGMGGVRYQSATLTEHLASHGYVVVSPDHEGTILLDVDWDALAETTKRRPGDVIESIDHVIALADDDEHPWAGFVDGSRYAMMGHSLGAVTTMMVSGAPVDVDGLNAWCDENRGMGCQFLQGIDAVELEDTVLADPRVEVAVPISPGGWYAFGENGSGLAQLPETLVLGGVLDEVLEYDGEIMRVYDALPETKWLGTLEDAGHYAAFSDMCTLIPVFEDCREEEGFLSAEDGQAITEHVVTAWLGWKFKGEPSYADWLTGDALSGFPALTFEGELP